MSFRYRHGDRPLDGYTIKRGVGHGGFGEVYYAVSDGGREVALKTILQNHEIELRGVRHCINLKSPHLVSIFDVRSGEDGSPFVIMEYVSGPSLRDLLREHPNGMGQDKAAYLVREIGRGLAYLHNQGIVHRDLKPENIFYEDGYVKIGDYGLSKYISVSRQSGQTMSVGTVHYMAPEIGSGIYNQGIDIYALGIMTYELLTGKVPFTGDSFGEILMKHLTAKPELGDVGEPFHSVISKALEKKPEDRYRTVEDMVSELFQSGQLNDGLVGFSPASLSMVGRTAAGPSAAVSPPLAGASPPPAAASPPPVGDSGGSGGSPPPLPLATAPTAAGSPPPVVGPPPARGRAGTPGTAAPPGDPHGPPPLGGQPGRRPPGPAGTKSPVSLGYGEAEATDPLDQGQRLVRAVFISLAVAAAVLILSGGRGGLAIRGLVGFFFTVFSGAAAILVTEFNFASRFRIDAGMPRRVVAAFLALIPMVIGSALYGSGRNHSLMVLGFLASLLVINWRERLDPYRAERISVGQALLAGLVGFLFSALFPHGHFLLGAGGFLVISLLVNALSPFVPYHLRREIMEQKGHAGAGRVAAQGLPPGVAAAAPGGVGAPAERPA
ncbi:MAG: protein kinase, partial [Planctomycetota bacterium]|nr:protein kinase [Planctomycetota bacterium]